MKNLPLVLTLSCGILLAGCNTRNTNIANEELRDENERLTAELTASTQENSIIAKQRDEARMENQRLKEQIRGISKQLAGLNLGYGMSFGDGHISVSQDLAFGKGSDVLNDRAKAAIHDLARQLKGTDYADTTIIVVGHTDSTPVVRPETKSRFGDNFGLSAMRSAAVVRELVSAGIDGKRVRGAFRGEHAPAKANDSLDGKKANRRVEIFLHVAEK
jgi:flagellar motor protein MotB